MAEVRHEPSFEKFAELAAEATVVPVYRTLLADMLTPVSAFEKLADRDYAFLLESASGGEKIGRYSFLGADPMMLFQVRRHEVQVTREGELSRFEAEDPIGELEKLVSAFKAVHLPELPRFSGGAVGYFAYDAVRYVEHLPDAPPDELGVPDVFFMFFDLMLVFDHLNKTLMVIHSTRTDQGGLREAYDRAVARIDETVERLRTPIIKLADDITPRGDVEMDYESNFTQEAFESVVERCKEYIYAGDVFQVVPSQRLSARTRADAFDVYRALRVINPSPYMFYLSMRDLKLIGSSPEVMVKCEQGKVTVRPIAGTRKRGANDEEDRRLAAELLADPKERAEHIMLVDLGRNDVGRCVKYGTVEIEEEMIVERYSHVMHIVSTVSGMLRDGLTAFDAFRACFPAGTLTGAPKIRAMEILDEMEPVRRGPYGGAVVYFDFSGNMDTCITIRTIVRVGDRAYVQAGGGVVADSVPVNEYHETLNKARALFRALRVAEEGFPS